VRTEPATILVIEIGSVGFFLLVLPLAIVLARLHTVWQADRGTGLVLSGVVVLTGIFFALYFVGLVALTFTGAFGQ